jgi:hypothetical protein
MQNLPDFHASPGAPRTRGDCCKSKSLLLILFHPGSDDPVIAAKRVPKIERHLIQSENARKRKGNDKASPGLLQCAARKIG